MKWQFSEGMLQSKKTQKDLHSQTLGSASTVVSATIVFERYTYSCVLAAILAAILDSNIPTLLPLR